MDAALAAGKPVVLLETNTASCNGFIGLSDSFASVLWATDMAMQVWEESFTNRALVSLPGMIARVGQLVAHDAAPGWAGSLLQCACAFQPLARVVTFAP